MKTNVHLKYLTKFFSEWEIFQTKAVQKIKTHFIFNGFFFFPKIMLFMTQCEKNMVQPDRRQMAI